MSCHNDIHTFFESIKKQKNKCINFNSNSNILPQYNFEGFLRDLFFLSC